MIVRKFKLKNKNGTIYDLTKLGLNGEKLESLFFEIAGLGFEKEFEFTKIDNVFVCTREDFTQKPVAGTMFFEGKNAYQKYYDFNRFIEKAPITLIYEPTKELGEFERVVKVQSLEKTEIGLNGLYCNIQFLPLTQVRKILFAETSINPLDGKRYNYKYNYQYSGGDLNSLTFKTDTSTKSPVKLMISGPCVAPEWKHYVNGKLKATGKITKNIPEGKKLIIDSNIPFSIQMTDQFEKNFTDYYQFSDFSTERFLFLEEGENNITVASEDGSELKIQAKGFVTYGTV